MPQKNLARLLTALSQGRWIIGAVSELKEDSSLRFEVARLEKLCDQMQELAQSSPLAAEDVDGITKQFLQALDGHRKLAIAYAATVADSLIGFSIKGLAYLSSVEKLRPLTVEELRRKRLAEDALRSNRKWLEGYLQQLQE
jgi:hypothetical protein